MKTFYVIIAAIIIAFLIGLIVFEFSSDKNFKPTKNSITSPVLNNKKYPPIPILINNGVLKPELTAESVYVVDVNSGVSLFEKNPDVKLLPASTTKIITALVALDTYDNDQVIKVGKLDVVGQKMGLVEGEQITAGDLISGLLIYSANDAAEALAESYPGGRDAFVRAMNQKARELNLENSNYTNPSGLDGFDLTTTARDLVRESVEAMKIPFFREVVGTKEKLVTSIDGTYKHKLTNINELVGEIPGVLGIKTGWTENAKENLVTYVQRDQKEIIFVVLKSNDRFGETKTLIDWAFNNHEWRDVAI